MPEAGAERMLEAVSASGTHPRRTVVQSARRLQRPAVERRDGLRLLDVLSDARAGRAQRAAVAAAAPYARLWGPFGQGDAVRQSHRSERAACAGQFARMFRLRRGDRRGHGCRPIRFSDRKIAARLPTHYPRLFQTAKLRRGVKTFRATRLSADDHPRLWGFAAAVTLPWDDFGQIAES
jgi:hypothetical protein